jgi:hypothetical protein
MAVALAGGVTFIAIERTTSPLLRAAANIRTSAGSAFLHRPASGEAPRRVVTFRFCRRLRVAAGLHTLGFA